MKQRCRTRISEGARKVLRTTLEWKSVMFSKLKKRNTGRDMFVFKI